jgi:single-strand DNA-binding protein
MSDLNQSFLIGRLVRNAELKYTSNGKAVSKFSIAVNKRRKIGNEWKDDANFFELVIWGQLAESLHPYLTKGKQIGIVGELTQERWEQDGQNRSKVTITVQSIQLLHGGSSGSEKSEQKTETYTVSYIDQGFIDDIPF